MVRLISETLINVHQAVSICVDHYQRNLEIMNKLLLEEDKILLAEDKAYDGLESFRHKAKLMSISKYLKNSLYGYKLSPKELAPHIELAVDNPLYRFKPPVKPKIDYVMKKNMTSGKSFQERLNPTQRAEEKKLKEACYLHGIIAPGPIQVNGRSYLSIYMLWRAHPELVADSMFMYHEYAYLRADSAYVAFPGYADPVKLFYKSPEAAIRGDDYGKVPIEKIFRRKIHSREFLLNLLIRAGIEENPGPQNKKKNNNNKKMRRQPMKRPKQQQQPKGASSQPFNVPRQSVQRQSEVVTLQYVETISDYNNAGGPIVSGEYRFSDIYDIDTAILSRTVQFVNYMFDIYTYAKVISASIEYVFDNLEQHALDVFCYHSTLPLQTSLGSKSTIENLGGTALCCRHQTMTEQYGSRSQLIIKFRLKSTKVLGNALEYKASEDFSCTSSSSPVRPLYTSWVVYTSGGTMPAGFSLRANIRLRVLFYNPRIITTPLFFNTRREPDEPNEIPTIPKLKPTTLTTVNNKPIYKK